MFRPLAISAAVALLLAACGSSTPPDPEPAPEEVGRNASAIIGGTDSPSTEDFVVRILGPDRICTGFLVAPKLVLTARHCIGGSLNFTVVNDQTTCTLSTQIGAPENFKVFIGQDYVSPAGVSEVTRVFANPSTLGCEHDIAALELKEPVAGISFFPLQLDGPPLKDEVVEAIGFGAIDDEGNRPAKRQKTDGKILSLNDKGEVDQGGETSTPSGSPVTIVAGYLLATARICANDSGGLLRRASTGDLLAVVHGYLGGADNSRQCTDSVALYVPLWTHREFIERVFQTQGIMPTRVGRPGPPADVGAACRQDNDCHTNYCVKVGSSDSDGTCSRQCTTSADCPSSMECTLAATSQADGGAGEYSVCLAPFPPPPKSSCDVSSSSASSGAPILGGLMGFIATALARRRRERRPS